MKCFHYSQLSQWAPVKYIRMDPRIIYLCWDFSAKKHVQQQHNSE